MAEGCGGEHKPRRRDSQRTKAAILRAATREFGTQGFAGARIEHIASTAKCNIRLLYHHFGNKKALYLSVLEAAYAELRAREAALDLDPRDPLGCVEQLLRFTCDYFERHPYLEGLLRSENQLRGRLGQPRDAARPNELLRALLTQGERQGVIRRGIDPAQLYVTIGALSRFPLANAWSLSALLESDLRGARWRAEWRDHAVEMLRAWLMPETRSADLMDDLAGIRSLPLPAGIAGAHAARQGRVSAPAS